MAVGCGPSGGNAATGWTAYDEPEGAYRVYYLEPPWEWVSHEEGVTRLRVAPNGVTRDGGLSALDKYDLQIRAASRDPEAAVARALSAATRQELRVLREPEQFETYEGQVAWELVFELQTDPLRYARQVWVSRPGGGSWLLELASTPDPRDPEVDHLFRLFVVDPEEAGEMTAGEMTPEEAP